MKEKKRIIRREKDIQSQDKKIGTALSYQENIPCIQERIGQKKVVLYIKFKIKKKFEKSAKRDIPLTMKI